MYRYDEIVAQDKLINYIKKIISSKAVSHAYIIQDDYYEESFMLAAGFAMALLCEKEKEEACHSCHSCKQILKNNHPDYIVIEPESKKSISVSDIREKIGESVSVKPYSARKKVYIINKADSMTKEAQNALLKTIEEAPEYAIMILVARDMDRFLDTVKSRCIKLKLSPVAEDRIAGELRNKAMPDKLAGDIARLSRGSLGKAKSFLKEEARVCYEENLNILKSVAACTTLDIYRYAGLIKNRDDKLEFLDFCLNWYRDILLLICDRDTDKLVFLSEKNTLRKLAKSYKLSDLEDIVEGINLARSEIESNVNPELVIELMLMKFRLES